METLYEKSSLILNPGVYDTGKVYCTKPFDGSGDLTFTRNSNATRVNADGLVEKVRQNLLLYSNDFSSAAWVPTGATTPTLTSGQADKDGGTNAWLISWGATIGTSYIYQSFSNLTTTHTASCWVKGTAGLKIKFGYGLNIAQGADITFTGEWQRVSHTSSSGSLFFFSNFITGLASSFYVQYCQSELSDIATDYIPTTSAAVSVGPTANVPRLDYSGGTCPSLLLEPQCTALLQYSEQLDNAYWSVFRGSITANAAISPDGYQNADKFSEDSATGQHFFRRQTLSMTSGLSYTGSIFAKAAEKDTLIIGTNNASLWNVSATFNLSTGTVTSGTGKIEDYGNGWYRCSVTGACLSTTSSAGIEFTTSSGAGSSGEGIYVWGANLTQTSYVQSYIPTLGASVTRLKDNATQTDVSGLLGAGTGTAFIDFVIDGPDVGGNIPLTIGTGVVDLVYVWVRTALGIQYEAYKSGSLQCSISTSAGYATYGSRYKIAIVWGNNDFAMYINGTLIGTDTNGTGPTPTKLWLGQYTGSNYDGATINQTLLFPTRLTNAQLAELTTL